MKSLLFTNLLAMGLTGVLCGALGYCIGKKSGYKEGCADTIEMYEWLTTNDHDYQQAIKNNKILDMFIDRE